MPPFDLGDFISDLGTTVANKKGFDSLEELALEKVASNVARITDKPNETKQTPPLQAATAYTSELLASQGAFGLTKGQMILIGAMGAVALFFVIRR